MSNPTVGSAEYIIIFGVKNFLNEAISKVITSITKQSVPENNILTILDDELSSYINKRELIIKINTILGKTEKTFIALGEIEPDVATAAESNGISLKNGEDFLKTFTSTGQSHPRN